MVSKLQYKNSTDGKKIKAQNNRGTWIVQMVNKISTRQYKYKVRTDCK